MKLAKIAADPNALAEFFQAGLEALGAVCERTWHDRLQVVAEGTAARLWRPGGELLETEIRFPPPGQTGPRDAATEVFPGCPLTFRLAEALAESPLPLHRVGIETPDQSRPPTADVAERLWRLQFPGTTQWWPETPFQAGWHFSLLVLARCEIQAIDQHWSLHRVALSLPDGDRDESLARDLDVYAPTAAAGPALPWPPPEPAAWQAFIHEAMTRELESDLTQIRGRQESYLRRELDRIDDYFRGYEAELRARLHRNQRAPARLKLEDRLAAARSEHERRRLDQVQRHEIRVLPHLDALVLLAERAWQMTVNTPRAGGSQTQAAAFIPRTRRWSVVAD